ELEVLPHRGRGGIELLRYRHERYAVLIERCHHAGEVEQRAAEPIDFTEHYAIDLAGLDVGKEAAQRRPLHAAAGVATVVVALGQASPAFMLLAGDVGLSRFALRVERVELLLQAFFTRFAGIDGAAQLARRLWKRVVIVWPPC